MSVHSRSGITSSKKEGELLSHHSEKWKQSQIKSSLSCFDQVIIWTKTSQGKNHMFWGKLQNLGPCSPRPYNNQEFHRKDRSSDASAMWVQSSCHTQTPSLMLPARLNSWTLCVGWLHGTATVGWSAGGWWGGWRWHSSSVWPPTCWGSSSKLWVSSLHRLGCPPATRVYSTPSTEIVKGQFISGSH